MERAGSSERAANCASGKKEGGTVGGLRKLLDRVRDATRRELPDDRFDELGLHADRDL
jgi:hypothetical protein